MKYIGLYRFLDYYLGIVLCTILTLLRLLILPFRRDAIAGPERMLFIELSEMGSTILAYPAIRAVQAAHPGAELYFLTFRRNRDGAALLDIFEDGRILTLRDDTLRGLVADLLRLMGDYRRLRFAAAFDFELFSRFSVMLAFLTGAPRTVGFCNYTAEGLYRGKLLSHRVLYNPHIHMAHNFLAMAHALDADTPEPPLLKRPVDEAEIVVPAMAFDPARLQRYREEVGGGGPVVVINHDAGPVLPIRNWGLDNYLAVIDGLTGRHGARVVLVGTASSRTSGDALLARAARRESILDMIGRTPTIRDLVHLIEVADIFLTNDSGPGHFASLTSTRTLVFFGPETPRLYGPIGGNCVPLYADYACSPCLTAANHRLSPCRRSRCLEAITPTRVLAEIGRHLPRAEDSA